MNEVEIDLGLASWRLPGHARDTPRIACFAGASFVQLDLGGKGRGPVLDAPDIARALDEALAAHPTRVTAVSVNTLNDIGLVREDHDGRFAVRDVVGRAIRKTASLGGRHVLVPSFRRSRINDAQDLRRTAECLRWAVAEAAAEGVEIATENVLLPDALVQLLDLVGRDELKVLVDTGNLRDAGVALDAYCAAARSNMLEHVHVKGPAAGAHPLLAGSAARNQVRQLIDSRCGVNGLVLESDHRDGTDTSVAADLQTLRGWITDDATTEGKP